MIRIHTCNNCIKQVYNMIYNNSNINSGSILWSRGRNCTPSFGLGLLDCQFWMMESKYVIMKMNNVIDCVDRNARESELWLH